MLVVRLILRIDNHGTGWYNSHITAVWAHVALAGMGRPSARLAAELPASPYRRTLPRSQAGRSRAFRLTNEALG